MKIKELQTLLDAQPSVSGSTFFVGAIFIGAALFATAFLILGIGLLMESQFHIKIFLEWMSRNLGIALNDDQRWKIATSFGLISLVLALFFTGVIFLCRMILKRNHYMIQMEDWIYGNLSEIRKRQSKSSK